MRRTCAITSARRTLTPRDLIAAAFAADHRDVARNKTSNGDFYRQVIDKRAEKNERTRDGRKNRMCVNMIRA